MAQSVSKGSLRNFNLFMSALHFIQAVVMLFISKDFKLPVNVSFLNYDQASQKLVLATEKLFDLPLVWVIAAFLLVSSLAHLIISTIYKRQYYENLDKGINKARWVEYSISASIMMVAIAMLVGIYDLGNLLMIFALTSVMNLMGLMMEVHNQTTKKVNWLSYNIGVFAGAIPWIVIALFFWAAETKGAGQIPTFVYWIYFSIFLFFNCFAVNMVLQYKKIGPWKEYAFGERVYIILSLVAKSALAWQVFAGTLRP